MKKYILTLLVAFVTMSSVFAVPASPEPFIYTQPDSSKLTLYNRGDEYYHWVETKDYAIVINNNGYYEYATIVDNQIVASGIRVSDQIGTIESQLSTREELITMILQKRGENIARLDSINKLEESKLGGDRSNSLTEGNQKVLCVLIGFPDMPFTKTQADFANMWNQIGYNYEGSQGSVKDFYLENSYGLLNVTATVVGPYVASHNSSYYDYDNGDHKALIREAMEAAKNDVQFSDFDVNNNYFVDLVHVVVAGYAREVTSSGVIWSHCGTLSQTQAVWQGIYRAKDYICTSELAGSYGTKVAPIGTVCHEYGHDLGAPDYYDINLSYLGFPGTGHWDVMCSGCWNGNHGRCPAHHNPYTKAYIYNWIIPMAINPVVSNMEYTIYPSHNSPTIYRINTNTEGEFFMIENKRRLGFNSYVTDTSNDGLLVYHIHSDIENAISNQNVNTSHPQKCYIVNANAISEPNNSPDSYGTDDNQWAYPTNSQIFFTEASTPSAVSWNGTPTDVNLCFIKKSGYNIKFTVNPIISGPSTLDSVGTYSVSNVPSIAKIKWTYLPLVQPMDLSLQATYPPLEFINGDSTSTISVRRGKFQVNMLSNHSDNILSCSMQDTLNVDDPRYSHFWLYYTGRVRLKATISCGGDTIQLSKLITYPSTNTSMMPLNDENSEQEEISEDLMRAYHLSHQNPITAENVTIRIYKSTNDTSEPIEEPYTLELRDNQYGLIRRLSATSENVTIETGSLSSGIYHLLLFVNGEIKATSKIIKY